jgi:galactose-1-phosphate uridylyltransferase
MSIEYGEYNGILRWIRNPFSGSVTYFNDIRRKPNSFHNLTRPLHAKAPHHHDLPQAALQAEMERVANTCVFCPGNESMTMEEVAHTTYGELYAPDKLPALCQADAWAIRVVHNIVPRVPEECTGGKNESYVMIEDARHFLPGATGLNDLMWSGALPAEHYFHILNSAAALVRRSFDNPTVKSVLIRKHQGRESGASQPHVHMQVIGIDRVFPDIEREMEVTEQHPDIWHEMVALMHDFSYDLIASDSIVSFWSPFGKFGRHFEVISLPDQQPIHQIPAARLRLFAQHVHHLLCALGTAPYDLEVHHGDGIPLHIHLNARRYVFANIGGTLNAPVDVAEHVVSPIRDLVRLFAQQTTNSEAD